MSSYQNVQDYVDKWLESWGFSGNPFRYWEAHREVHIDEYYVKHNFYEQLLSSNKSTMVFAYRGEGKSATRIMLQREYQPQKRTSDFLSIPFSDFTSIIDRYQRNKKVSFADYLPNLIGEALISLLSVCAFMSREDVRFTSKEISQFKYWIATYAPSILESRYVDIVIKQIWQRSSKAEIDNPKIDRWRKYLQDNDGNLDNIPNLNNPFWEKFFMLWADLKNAETQGYEDWNIAYNSAKTVMENFVRFILDLLSSEKYPCKTIIFLFDGIDEYDETRNNAEISSEILSPLLWEMWFHRIDGLTSKFFLPMEHKTSFVNFDTRWDLFEIFDLDWRHIKNEGFEAEIMKKLLRERIHFFSSGGNNTLTHMCMPEIGRLIEDEMIAETGRSPRNLIRLGNMLFAEHCKVDPEPKSLITLTEWENALLRYRANIHMARRDDNVAPIKNSGDKNISGKPNLIIMQAARKVFRGNEEIILSESEFNLLLELNRKIGQLCSEEELIEALYRQNYSKRIANSLRSHIRHLRNKIEFENLQEYYYLKNVRGRGYYLEHVDEQ